MSTRALREARRLGLLELLREAPAYTSHAYVLRDGLSDMGLAATLDSLRADLAWLDEQDLVVLADGEVPVATITQRGEDCARGRARVPGVARPSPKD